MNGSRFLVRTAPSTIATSLKKFTAIIFWTRWRGVCGGLGGGGPQEKCENYTRTIINHVYFFKHFFSFSIVVRQPHTRPLLPGDGERARSTATDSRRKGRRLRRHLEEPPPTPPPSPPHHTHTIATTAVRARARARTHTRTRYTSNSHPSVIFQARSIQPLGEKKLFFFV